MLIRPWQDQGWDSCANCAILIQMQIPAPNCGKHRKLREIAPHCIRMAPVWVLWYSGRKQRANSFSEKDCNRSHSAHHAMAPPAQVFVIFALINNEFFGTSDK